MTDKQSQEDSSSSDASFSLDAYRNKKNRIRSPILPRSENRNRNQHQHQDLTTTTDNRPITTADEDTDIEIINEDDNDTNDNNKEQEEIENDKEETLQVFNLYICYRYKVQECHNYNDYK